MSTDLFCTCADSGCPFHPSNHDMGCTPCIEKNLKEREIPTCFFNAAGGEKPTHGWHFEDFAALISAREGREHASPGRSKDKGGDGTNVG